MTDDLTTGLPGTRYSQRFMNHPLLQAWHEAAMELLPPATRVWDAHTHTGDTDPDGFTNTAEQLTSALDAAHQAGAVVCPSADPLGYRLHNDRVLAEAKQSGDRLIPFMRVAPLAPGAVDEVRRGIDAGHRGIKLHPRSDEFELEDPLVREIADLAARRRIPILVHAGRGMDPLGPAPLRLLDTNPGLQLILAHCGISDLAALAPEARTRPNLLFDTAWWNPADLAALFAWVDASQIVYASDMPYGAPLMSATITARAAIQAGLSGPALSAVFGGNLQSVLDGVPAAPLGIGVAVRADPGLLRVASNLFGAIETAFAGLTRAQPLELTLRATETVPTPHDELYRAIATTVRAVIDLHESHPRERIGLLVVACSAALTPSAGHPQL